MLSQSSKFILETPVDSGISSFLLLLVRQHPIFQSYTTLPRMVLSIFVPLCLLMSIPHIHMFRVGLIIAVLRYTLVLLENCLNSKYSVNVQLSNQDPRGTIVTFPDCLRTQKLNMYFRTIYRQTFRGT